MYDRKSVLVLVLLCLFAVSSVFAATPSFGDVQCIGGVCTFFSNGGITSSNYETAYNFYTDGDTGTWNLKDTNAGSCRYCYYQISTDTYTLETSGSSCSAFDASYGAPGYVGYLTGVAWYNTSKGWWDCYAVHINSGSATGAPVSDFNSNPVSDSSYYPVTVEFSDNSTYVPTSYNWTVTGNSTIYTTRNITYYFEDSGTYTISHGVSNSYGSSIVNKTYIVKSYSVPSCSYTVTDLDGSSPLGVNFTDTSGGSPTSYYWNFDVDDYPWITVSPSKMNTTSNPHVLFSGSGGGYIAHSVTNPAGTSTCALRSFNLSGPVPTPTPTPSVPFPNQTGICRGASISTGSGWTSGYDVRGELTEPDGMKRSNYYDAGSVRMISGEFTTKLGQYYYAERNLSNVLEYQMSYVVEDCLPTPTITGVFTTIPTYIVTVVPTVAPSPVPTSITPETDLDTVIVVPVVTVPTLVPSRNSTASNITQTKENIKSLNPLFGIYINTVDGIMYPFYVLIMGMLSYLLGYLSFFAGVQWAVNTFTTLLGSFSNLMVLTNVTLAEVIDNIPVKVQNVITFCLIIDFIKQVYNLKRGDRL